MSEKDTAEKTEDKEKKDLPAKPIETQHSIKVGSKTLSYTANTGMMPLKDDKGEPHKLVGVLRDISERKQVEKEKKELTSFVDRYKQIETSIDLMQKSILSLADKRDKLFDELDTMKSQEKTFMEKLIKKYGKDWAKMVESINEAGGDWVVVDLNTKKVTYVKSYDAASKYVKKNGGVTASSEYYADNKKKFEDTSFEGEPLDEDKYTDLGLSVTHTLNMAQTFWYKLGGKVKVDPKKYAKLEADYVKRGKVTVKQ